MTCCMLQHPDTGFLPYSAVDTHKRAPVLQELHSLVQQAPMKRIRTNVDTWTKLQIKHETSPSAVSLRGGGWFGLQTDCDPNSINGAFNLLSECDREFLNEQLQQELKGQADCRYLHTVQRDIDPQKRLVLIDWLSEVVEEFELRQATLYLAVSVLDRFLSQQEVPRAQLQLLGVTCLWIASKFEDTHPPTLQEVVEITDYSYAASDVLRLEGIVLAQLQYQLAVPTSLTFLHQLISHVQEDLSRCSPFYDNPADMDAEVKLVHAAEYLLELALLTPDILRYRPSVIAASALQLALKLVPCDVVVSQACSKLCNALSIAAMQCLNECIAELERMQHWAATATQPPSIKVKYSGQHYSYVGCCRPCDISDLQLSCELP